VPHFNIKTGLCRNTGKIVLTLLEATARVTSPRHWIIPKNGTAPQERVDGKFSFRDGRDAEGGRELLLSGWLPLFERGGCTLILFKNIVKKPAATQISPEPER